MSTKQKQTTADDVQADSTLPWTEQKEASEPRHSDEAKTGQPHSNLDESFLDEPAIEVVEEFTVGETTVVFKEETDDLNPKDSVRMQSTGQIKSDYFDKDQEWAATVVGETPGGAELRIKKRENGSGYVLSFNGSGVLPSQYQGWYTSYDKAEVDARTYLNKVWEEHASSASA